MFYIFCYTRKEASLVAQCLNAHDDVVIPDETDFIAPAAFVFSHVNDPTAGREVIARLLTGTDRFPYSIGAYLTSDEVHDAVLSAEYAPAEIVKAVYLKIAEKQKKRVAGDVLLGDMAYAGILNATGFFSSDIKILHIVRDARDLIVSLRRLGRLDKYSEATYPAAWSGANLALYNLLSGQPSRYLMVRYEDFVMRPGELLGGICGFLGIEYSEKMLEPRRWAPRYTGEPVQTAVEKIEPGMIGEYKSSLAPDDIKYCEAEAREALGVFGYSVAPMKVGGLYSNLRRYFKKG